MHQLPETGFLRLAQIIGQKAITAEQAEENRKTKHRPRRPRPAVPAIIPVNPTTWWAGVKSGRFPAPVRFPEGRVTAWRVEDIRRLVDEWTSASGSAASSGGQVA